MEYKGYSARVTFDEDAEVFHGQVLHIRDLVTFQADTVRDLKREMAASVDEYLAFCEELGREPERPLSGRLLLRMDPELHRAAAVAADLEGTSLNSWICDRMRESFAPGDTLRAKTRAGVG